jgi:hypothetical protein
MCKTGCSDDGRVIKSRKNIRKNSSLVFYCEIKKVGETRGSISIV